MTKIIPTYGYNAKGETQLFQLEEGKKLPSGWSDKPQGDLKNGAVTPPDSTSLRQIPAPLAYDDEIVKDPSDNPNAGPGNFTPTTYPHLPGSSDIHPDDENHDGIDERRDPAATFNKPVTPPDITNVDPAPEVGADGQLVINPDDAARVEAERLNANQPVPELAKADTKADAKPAKKK